MPQLDRIIIFPQIFWLFIIFSFLYILLLHFFLPKFLNSLKLRKYICEFNVSKVSYITNKFNQDKLNILTKLNLSLKNIQNNIYLNNTKAIFLVSDFKYINPLYLTNNLVIIVKNNLSFCNKQILSSIKLYPSKLNK